ncbi:putative vacuolar protein sorting-associated protein 11-like isoform X2 [Penaeus vannamei]|uniref:Putative vacuolar protein sorting-associated protein 11-like isoform X2 n=1 Tax=Penaeus vannamei TaxID=6689 RepID=A0A423TPL7_PENVA|nr:putative vacuolar protein sorting-associated protein 11-like isoform X2 [Penaeus vannamei]
MSKREAGGEELGTRVLVWFTTPLDRVPPPTRLKTPYTRLGLRCVRCEVTCTAAGRGHVYIGDSTGCVHSLTRQLKLDSFQAFDRAVKSITAFDHTSIIITVADKNDGPSEIKVWAPDKADVHGQPPCLRTLCPDPRPNQAGSRASSGLNQAGKVPKVTALAVHPNLSLMAVGFQDGSVMLYRGEVSRDRGSKHRVLLTVSSSITSLHIRHNTRATHLFVTTKNNIFCINCTARDKETTVELDSVGCEPGCATLADGRHEHFLVARPDCCDQEEVAEILRQYGDWLYSKGNHPAAMDQYIKTIPHLEPSYVIRKYLDTQHIHNLTTYLQALHRSGSATADHTSLLLNCYTRLRDTQQLDEFIMSKDGAVDCDVELGVRVCRSAGYYDHALLLQLNTSYIIITCNPY